MLINTVLSLLLNAMVMYLGVPAVSRKVKSEFRLALSHGWIAFAERDFYTLVYFFVSITTHCTEQSHLCLTGSIIFVFFFLKKDAAVQRLPRVGLQYEMLLTFSCHINLSSLIFFPSFCSTRGFIPSASSVTRWWRRGPTRHQPATPARTTVVHDGLTQLFVVHSK